MINKETILSTYNDRLTLLEWLKKVEQGLSEGVLEACELVKTARASFKFKLTFEDGTFAESNVLTIETDDIASASFVGGHLIFVTEDGRTIDAGHLSGNLGNVICTALDVHGDIHADGSVFVGGDVNINGVINSSNIGELDERITDLKVFVEKNTEKLQNVDKTQYGLSINEYTTINGKLHVTGDIEVDGQGIVEVEANPQEEGATDLTKLKVGDIVYNIPSGGGGVTLENITDADGNLRFVGGDLTINETIANDLTIYFAKWSLSGSHFSIVLSARCTSAFTGLTTLARAINIPQFIHDKIVAVYGSNVDTKEVLYFSGSSGSIGGNFNVYLQKANTSSYPYTLSLVIPANTQINQNTYFRIQFDFLID